MFGPRPVRLIPRKWVVYSPGYFDLREGLQAVPRTPGLGEGPGRGRKARQGDGSLLSGRRERVPGAGGGRRGTMPGDPRERRFPVGVRPWQDAEKLPPWVFQRRPLGGVPVTRPVRGARPSGVLAERPIPLSCGIVEASKSLGFSNLVIWHPLRGVRRRLLFQQPAKAGRAGPAHRPDNERIKRDRPRVPLAGSGVFLCPPHGTAGGLGRRVSKGFPGPGVSPVACRARSRSRSGCPLPGSPFAGEEVTR